VFEGVSLLLGEEGHRVTVRSSSGSSAWWGEGHPSHAHTLENGDQRRARTLEILLCAPREDATAACTVVDTASCARQGRCSEQGTDEDGHDRALSSHGWASSLAVAVSIWDGDWRVGINSRRGKVPVPHVSPGSTYK
jgi:hypothetical protein